MMRAVSSRAWSSSSLLRSVVLPDPRKRVSNVIGMAAALDDKIEFLPN
jgi:hypothetical protein